jgi:hypothetical protein
MVRQNPNAKRRNKDILLFGAGVTFVLAGEMEC